MGWQFARFDVWLLLADSLLDILATRSTFPQHVQYFGLFPMVWLIVSSCQPVLPKIAFMHVDNVTRKMFIITVSVKPRLSVACVITVDMGLHQGKTLLSKHTIGQMSALFPWL